MRRIKEAEHSDTAERLRDRDSRSYASLYGPNNQRAGAGDKFRKAMDKEPEKKNEKKLKKRYGVLTYEDAPTNAAGSGAIAGMGVGKQGEPGVYQRKRNKYKRSPVIMNLARKVVKR